MDKRILWFISGNLGDCILSCYSILRLNPKYKITVVSNILNITLIKRLGLPVETIEVNSSLLSLLKNFKFYSFALSIFSFLKQRKDLSRYDYVIEPFSWKHGFIMECYLLNIKKKFYYLKRNNINLFDHQIIIHEKIFNVLGLNYHKTSLLKNYIKYKKINSDYILICPFSRDPMRTLKFDTIKNIIEKSSKDKVIVLAHHSDNDQALMKDILDYKLKVHYYTFDNIEEFNTLLHNAKKIYCSESFISHYANFCNTGVKALYSGFTDKKHWYMFNNYNNTKRINIYCAPCYGNPVKECKRQCLDFNKNEIN